MSEKKKECPGCAMMVDADADVCPICGYEFPRRSTTLQIVAWILIIILLLFWVIW
ncbi:MAG TPA: zinc ribbon domain-containing protein [Balneolaceae bacterium]|nr:zinc ribbon domain-containing protein [Balneolaceae bacterium]